MKLSVRDVGEVSVIDVSGKLTRVDGGALLGPELEGLLARGRRKLIVNLQEVPYMDSAGMGELIACHQRASAAGGTIKLLNPLKRVYDVLQLVKLDSVFEIFQDEAAAAGSFID